MQLVPQDIIDLSDSISETQDVEDKAASELMSLYARMCNLLATAQDTRAHDPSNSITEAIALDEKLAKWASHLPHALEPWHMSAASCALAYADQIEVHSSVFSAEIWILYRSARMGVNGLIAVLYSSILAHLPPQEQPRMENAGCSYDFQTSAIASRLHERLSILETIRCDMCAIVPFLLDRHHEAHPPALKDLPLRSRTPVINLLLFFTKDPGVPKAMLTWAMGLLAELRADQDVDKGAIWMNNSPQT